jgi:hypothetical protein
MKDTVAGWEIQGTGNGYRVGGRHYFAKLEDALEFIARRNADRIDGGIYDWLREYRQAKDEILTALCTRIERKDKQ